MRIEKISDTQVKFILSREDLLERDLRLSELTYHSDKAQRLFRDMMEQAAEETGFEVDATPLVIEAVPVSSDCIMVIVSKVEGKKEDYTSPLSNLFSRLSKSDAAEYYEDAQQYQPVDFDRPSERKRVKTPKNITIYSFRCLDDVFSASSRLQPTFRGASSLYKYDGKYFICLQLPFKTAVIKMGDLETILDEYGEKHISNTISRGFLLEHGETIINANAVNKLASV